MSDRGWCPFARQHRGYGHEGPFGYPAGARGQNRPVVLVHHRMAGHKRTLDDDGWRHRNWTSVHFGIGRDGSIDQYVSIFDAAWGNGVGRPISGYDRSNPRLAMLETLGAWRAVTMGSYTTYALVAGGVNVINTHTISVEHEDEGRDQPWTDAMTEASVRVARWCIEELARADMPLALDDYTLVGHYQIDATDRAGCPGRHWPRQRILDNLRGGRMYSDQDIDRKIAELRDAVGHIAEAQAGQIKRVEDAVSATGRLVRELLRRAQLPEPAEDEALRQLEAYLRAVSGDG